MVLRSELQASPLADLHLIADQVGVEGYRRMRKADLIDAILAEQGSEEDGGETPAASAGEEAEHAPRRRSERGRTARERAGAPERAGPSARGRASAGEHGAVGGRERRSAAGERAGAGGRERTGPRGVGRERAGAEERPARSRAAAEREVEGVVEILGNGSAFLRVHPPEPSEDDVYISAAQVRRCELVSGDRVSGPARTPRRSERYPSLIRVESINDQPAQSVAEGTRYDDMPCTWPSERIALDSQDPTLKAIEWLTPLGHGSRALIVGAARAGKTETLRRILGALGGREGVEPMLVLAGVRPEEIHEWQQGPVAPLAALSFASSADAQGQAVEGVLDTARRLAARGAHPIVLIDSLDGLHPHTARRALAAARNLSEGGSLTVIATASRPFGGETTVIALDAAHTSTGRLPALDLLASGTLRAERLVGEDGAEAIIRARAAAAES